MATFLNQAQNLYTKTKREISENLLSQALNVLGHASKENHQRLVSVFERMANTEQQRLITKWISRWISEGPGSQFLTRLLTHTHPNVRKNYIAKMITNLFFRDPKTWAHLRNTLLSNPPAVILISPTMRCNYRCVGCYAGEYDQESDLPEAVFDRVLREAKEIGVHFFAVTGGEPFIYRPLLDIFRRHHDMAFQVYTNGSLIDSRLADRLLELGNVSPQISLEGFREQTDARRGPGAFDRVMRAMGLLRERGLVFAFSATVTRDNVDVLTSDAFVDLMIEKGATYGWFFLYMPVGRDADINLQPTPEQRNQVRLAVERFRNTKPILLADFWGDSALTGGCIAAGRIYVHINNRGDLEPCIFCHFTVDGANIQKASLTEALQAPFFTEWRKGQPFSYNALRPCPIVDHPDVVRGLIQRFGARPTEDGADHIIREFQKDIDRYSAGVNALYSPAWEEERCWTDQWMLLMDFPEEKIKTRKAGYYRENHASREPD